MFKAYFTDVLNPRRNVKFIRFFEEDGQTLEGIKDCALYINECHPCFHDIDLLTGSPRGWMPLEDDSIKGYAPVENDPIKVYVPLESELNKIDFVRTHIANNRRVLIFRRIAGQRLVSSHGRTAEYNRMRHLCEENPANEHVVHKFCNGEGPSHPSRGMSQDLRDGGENALTRVPTVLESENEDQEPIIPLYRVPHNTDATSVNQVLFEHTKSRKPNQPTLEELKQARLEKRKEGQAGPSFGSGAARNRNSTKDPLVSAPSPSPKHQDASPQRPPSPAATEMRNSLTRSAAKEYDGPVLSPTVSIDAPSYVSSKSLPWFGAANNPKDGEARRDSGSLGRRTSDAASLASENKD